MKRYLVRSGPLKITIIAATAYDAAMEAVRWWDDSQLPGSADSAHRANLDAVIEVRCQTSRSPRLFPTFRVLARAAGESQDQAWTRVLQAHLCNVN